MGWLIPLCLLLPHALLTRYPPAGTPRPATDMNRLVQVLERLGQVGVFATPRFY